MSVHVCETKHCQFTEIRSVESDLPHAYWQWAKRVQCTVYTQRSNFKRKQTQGRIGNKKGVSCYQAYCLQVTKEYCGIKKTLTETFDCYGKRARLFNEEHVNKRTANLYFCEGPYLQELYPNWPQCQLVHLPSTQLDIILMPWLVLPHTGI